MSVYTTQLRWVIENCTDSRKTLDERITDATGVLFGSFPIYREEHRTELLRKILLHFFNYEIGFETVGLWKIKINEHLNLIMPYYNQLYATADNNYNFLINNDYTETVSGSENRQTETTGSANSASNQTENGEGTVNKTASETTTQTDNGTSKELLSDLPQSTYTGVDYGTQMNDGETQNTTNVSKADTERSAHTVENSKQITNTSENTKAESAEKTHEAQKTIAGLWRTSRAKLLKEYREQIINIDQQIVESCKPLFMLIW